jgi:hypothetical protein
VKQRLRALTLVRRIAPALTSPTVAANPLSALIENHSQSC